MRHVNGLVGGTEANIFVECVLFSVSFGRDWRNLHSPKLESNTTEIKFFGDHSLRSHRSQMIDCPSMMLFIFCCIHYFENVTLCCNHSSPYVNGVLLNGIDLNSYVISCVKPALNGQFFCNMLIHIFISYHIIILH